MKGCNKMKKKVTYTILVIFIILLLTITTVGITYSFFVTSATGKNQTEATGKKFEIIYTGGTDITGPIELATKKEEGLSTTVNIKIAQGSAVALADIYINVEKITSNIAIEGLIWEVVGIKNSTQVYYNKGNFSGVNNTTNNIVTVVDDYLLSEDNTAFTVYLWLDGNKVDNSVLNSEFKGYIGAKTENFTGINS